LVSDLDSTQLVCSLGYIIIIIVIITLVVFKVIKFYVSMSCGIERVLLSHVTFISSSSSRVKTSQVSIQIILSDTHVMCINTNRGNETYKL